MVDEEHSFPDEVTRVPTEDDLARVCDLLNKRGASYVVIGGAAIIAQGLLRTTHDIDLLLDPGESNFKTVCEVLSDLPDGAAKEVQPGDLDKYVVIRINDEITIDLMGSACGVDYARAESMIDWKEVKGVRIPFASPELLWITKQTHREKDALDRAFLRKWFEDRGKKPPAVG